MRRIAALFLCVLFASSWSVVPLPAQQKPADKAGDIPVFKTSSNLVLVSVYVRGKDGKPVENLKPEDFTVLENGKQQANSVFEFQRLTDVQPKPEEKKLEIRAAPETKPVEEAAPVTTSARFKDKRLLVLYVDWTSMSPAEQFRAKEGAEKAVR